MIQEKTMELFVKDWTFLKTPLDTELSDVKQKIASFQPVELPHDWLIYQSRDLYEDSFGWYRKLITVEEKAKHFLLRFDGVYMNCTVYVNEKAVFDWKYGYSTFTVDLAAYLEQGENELMVLVRHQSPNSRWYSGAGIYRNVWKKECGECFLPLDGTYVVTSLADKNISLYKPLPSDCDFQMDLETEVEGAGDNTLVAYSLWQQEACVAELGVSKVEEKKASLLTTIKAPKLWSIDNPNCYELHVDLMDGAKKVDSQQYTVGFRTKAFDPEKGFFLNGSYVKVHGVCEHHDLGSLGSAFHLEALRRQFVILKEMGANGIRTSHNMPAPEFMELADRMGFLVLSEAFDMWERPKTTYDYARFFIEWAGKDVESWVRRDRNHPSLLMWSIGNEIYDTHADAHGQEITRRLCGYVKQHDPKGNAEPTIGSNYMPWEGAQNCADIVKMAGYNYGERYYADHHKAHPDWIMYGSETASVVQSRGIYHFPLSQSILSDEDEQCSALGNSSTSWGAESTVKCITDDRDATFIWGQFIWTGFDYIGEPTPYHTKNSYFGQIDTAGFPKDSYYIFQAEWTDYKKAPMVHLYPYWDFNPGQKIDVCVCSNCPEVELFVNGKSMGRKQFDHQHGLELLANWQVPYEAGTILAIAYDEQGLEVARQQHVSFGTGKSLVLTADKSSLQADGKDLCFLTIETVDENGNPVENAVDYVDVKVEGEGRLLGMDNGDSTDVDSYKCGTRKLFSGKLLAIVGSTTKAGSIRVTVTGEGLEPASLELLSCGETLEEGYLEDCQDTPFDGRKTIPVRKVELVAHGDTKLTPDCKEVLIDANIFPANADDVELIFRVVNDTGIEVNTAKIEKVTNEDGRISAKLVALGDGAFKVRCMAKDSMGKITVISQLEFEATGLGTTFLNPYELITAGLFSDSIGDIGNGNEKGISTARDGVSGVVFDNVDFGDYGSDELTMPIFALDGQTYEIDIWLGKPLAEGSRLLTTVQYQKPPIWNVYQEETFKLPERIKGVVSIGFTLKFKVHIKGFYFTKQNKAYGRLFAMEANRVYGDTFEKKEKYVEEIGNNVTLEYDDMHFDQEGATRVTICGRTPLANNTIHMRFTPSDGGEIVSRMAEFAGDGTGEYRVQTFSIEKLSGVGRLDFVFLPGSQFDFAYFQFQ